ncbi:MAG: hypothetical protein AB1489_12030, partial [Acidobacteriota bacterium]
FQHLALSMTKRKEGHLFTPDLRTQFGDQLYIFCQRTFFHLLKGLIVLRRLTGNQNARSAYLIAEALLPQITDEKGRYLPYRELIDMVTINRDKPPSEALRNLHQETALKLAEALELASGEAISQLDEWRAELEQRKVAGGVGIPKLPKRAYAMLHLVEKHEADYISDVRSAGNAAADQVARAFSQLNLGQGQADPIVMAQAMALALQQMGFGPQAQPTAQRQTPPQPIQQDMAKANKPPEPKR